MSEQPERIAARLAYALYTLTNCISQVGLEEREEQKQKEYCLLMLDTSNVDKRMFENEAKQLRRACREGDYRKALEILRRHRGEPLERALSCIYSLCRCDTLPQRMDAFASVAAENLLNAILFYISKADRTSYQKIYSVLSQLYKTYVDSGELGCDNVDKVLGQEARDIVSILYRECRDEGYSTILALISIGLEELGIVDKKPGSLDELVGRVAEDYDRIVVHRESLEPYMVALKRLLKGYYG